MHLTQQEPAGLHPTCLNRPDPMLTGILLKPRCCHAACFRRSCDVSCRVFVRLDPGAAQVEACRLSGLAAIRERSPSLDQITLDLQSLAVSKANTKVGDTPIKMVVMGDDYLQRDTSDKPNRFICLLSDHDKVVLTFFTEQQCHPLRRDDDCGSRCRADPRSVRALSSISMPVSLRSMVRPALSLSA